MAIAEAIYVEPSALAQLYINQERSREITLWRAKAGPLPVTHHGRAEIVNAISRARFLGKSDEAGMKRALNYFTEDFRDGRLYQADILWRSALNRAADLSMEHTPTLGTRASDVLHVACALELNCRRFLTFDERQRQLALAVGLKLVSL